MPIFFSQRYQPQNRMIIESSPPRGDCDCGIYIPRRSEATYAGEHPINTNTLAIFDSRNYQNFFGCGCCGITSCIVIFTLTTLFGYLDSFPNGEYSLNKSLVGVLALTSGLLALCMTGVKIKYNEAYNSFLQEADDQANRRIMNIHA